MSHLTVILSFVLLVGCGVAENKIDLQMSFSAESDKSLVIAGIDASAITDVNTFSLIFTRYDPDAQKIIADSDIVSPIDTWWHHGLTMSLVDPGHYLLSDTIIGPNLKRGNYLNTVRRRVSGRITSETSVAGIDVFRFQVKPGEAVYLGEYLVGQYKPEWVNQADVLAAQLAKMPNITAKPVFRPPVERNN